MATVVLIAWECIGRQVSGLRVPIPACSDERIVFWIGSGFRI